MNLTRLLILDDLFGRSAPNGLNVDRENLCAHFLWQDATGDIAAKASKQKVLEPTAEAVFCRAQVPASSQVGDTVQNDLESALAAVRKGWKRFPDSEFGIWDSVSNSLQSATRNQKCNLPWSMLLLDLCFYTGRVTEESHRRTPGMPEGRAGDDDPRSYFGLTLLDAIHREFPELPVFILSSKPRNEVALEFSRRGALGFIDRSDAQAPELLEAALWNHGLLPDPAGEVLGHSLPLLLALREARRAGSHRENILIRGERGTGKELMARYLHGVATRAGSRGPLVDVNSAVFTPNLFASELFGIQARTATGVDGKVGLIESADGGDLFLDEIADMPAEVQAAVLRVLQERQVTRVGSRKAVKVDVRFLSATNAELEDEAQGFRPDLLDRLRLGGTVWLPPLRDRTADIPLLTNKFVREAEQQRAGTRHRQVTDEAMALLTSYDWPGNVRELRSAVFDAVTRHPDVEYLVPQHLRIVPVTPGRSRPASDGPDATSEAASARSGSAGIQALLQNIAATEVDPSAVDEWSGQLAGVQRECAWLIARMLQAALDATRRRTPGCPDGELQIQPAAQMLTGDAALTGSKAADLIKRILTPIEDELEGDLRRALDIAVRLRPRSAPRTAKPRSQRT